ncbi:hypothetical protein GBAR_LOCUS20048 [Geodia barretti]|uniref:Uncharacterized protein n=1 Tax=Geodia barretti TaxID=519541 RepID=A0AA35SUR9_GEOBA|nr:hypothetical protein GBAR_LOCUS20048 [Geodia barretti]
MDDNEIRIIRKHFQAVKDRILARFATGNKPSNLLEVVRLDYSRSASVEIRFTDNHKDRINNGTLIKYADRMRKDRFVKKL